MEESFLHDAYIGYGEADHDVALQVAERLLAAELRAWLPNHRQHSAQANAEALERSRVLVLCISERLTADERARLEAEAIRFRDPLNKGRRLVLLLLDRSSFGPSFGTAPSIDWSAEHPSAGHVKLLAICRPSTRPSHIQSTQHNPAVEILVSAGVNDYWAYAISHDQRFALLGGRDGNIRLWDLLEDERVHLLEGHRGPIVSLLWSEDGRQIVSAATDRTIRRWDTATGLCSSTLYLPEGKSTIEISPDGRLAISSTGASLQIWDIDAERDVQEHFRRLDSNMLSAAWSKSCTRVATGHAGGAIAIWDTEDGTPPMSLRGHTDAVLALAWSPDQRLLLSASEDRTVRLWDVESGTCTRVLEGHSRGVTSLCWSSDGRFALSGSPGVPAVLLWDLDIGSELTALAGTTGGVWHLAWEADQRHAVICDGYGQLLRWDLSDFIESLPTALAGDQVQYTNAKVLLVGDTSSGKTALAHRLVTRTWKPSEVSTVGAWATQLCLSDPFESSVVDREIWFWDFGGQADQRLVHQLFVDHAALVLLLFDADKEDVLQGLRDWRVALRRSIKTDFPLFIVAGRIDAGFKASRAKLERYAEELGAKYCETSAFKGDGCDDLRDEIVSSIPWDRLPTSTSPAIFKQIKDAILELRSEGVVVVTFKELRGLLINRLSGGQPVDDDALQTVIRLLDGPGIVKEMEYGTYILLVPEWINSYAQAVIRTLRAAANSLGVLRLRSIADGDLIYQAVGRNGLATEMKRLPRADERIVLGEMERQLEDRGICIRQDDKLVFPSHCGRDRPTVQKHPAIFVSYAVKGFLDDIYASLVVKLSGSQSFALDELWRDAADFVTLNGHHRMGVKLTRGSASEGAIEIYFGDGVTQEEQVIFANYIHAHLFETADECVRFRHYVCPHCHTPKENAEVLHRKLLAMKEKADTECDKCERRFPLWDGLEQKFASEDVRRTVEQLQSSYRTQLTTRRKAKLLLLDVGARFTSANQKWLEVAQDEDDGIDIIVEFTDDRGYGLGKGLYLQLKAGNSHLKQVRRGDDLFEIFRIKKERWVKTWMAQPYPVMLVIGTVAETSGWTPEGDKVEFLDVRWMEISSVLKHHVGRDGSAPRQIEFRGERLDMESILRWRRRILGADAA